MCSNIIGCDIKTELETKMKLISTLMIQTVAASAALILLVTSGQAVPITMDFEGLISVQPGSGATTTTSNYLEDGMTMSPSYTHYDVFNNVAIAPPTSGVIDVIIHQGNNGAGVGFTFASGNFDASSLDIIAWLDTNPNVADNTVTFSSSAGGSHTIDNTFTGTIDFSSITGFANISSFSISAPNPSIDCRFVACPQMAFDTFVFDDLTPSSVPVPAALPLFGTGLALMGFVSWRRKRKAV